MELYESNYILLRRLCPALREETGDALSSVRVGPDLSLTVIGHGPYASTLRLTHLFRDVPDVTSPDLCLRIYHDARVAEVCIDGKDGVGGALRDRGLLERRWRANRFLQRWLCYCLAEGHRFRIERPAR